MTKEASPVSKFIAERGGAKAWMEKLAVKPVTIRSWHVRGIPRARWPEVIEHVPGVTLEDLKRIEAA